MEELMGLDLYEILGIVPASSTKEIKAAYRKKALTCHPDKNPDNPNAAELFLRLSKILEILTDDAARASYDRVLNGRKQSKLRIREYDSKRRKLREDLEAREEAFRNAKPADSTRTSDEYKLQRDIERLQKDGSRQVEEELKRVHEEVKEQLRKFRSSETVPENQVSSYSVKIKWKKPKIKPDNYEEYNYASLNRILSKYGDIETLYIKSSKKGVALVEFKSRDAAEMAVKYEIGLNGNPLKLSSLWQSQKPEKTAGTETRMSEAAFESNVLSNLQRAEERKRLIEKMQAEEECHL